MTGLIRPGEQLPVGRRADHELVECLLGVDHDQPVGPDPGAPGRTPAWSTAR